MSLDNLQRKTSRLDYITSILPPDLDKIIAGRKKIPLPEGSRLKNLKASYLIDIVSTLVLKDITYGNRVSYNLHSLILKKNYGASYNLYIDFLTQNNIIKMMSNYWVQHKCRSYALCKYFDKDEYKIIENRDPILVSKRPRFTERHIKNNHSDTQIPLEIMKKVVSNLSRITIDIDSSWEYLKSEETDDKKYIKNQLSIEKLSRGDLWYNFDIYGRFHSNYTTLKSHIRNNYLRIDGEETREIDISNSQPTFLAFLIADNIDNYDVDVEEYELYKQLVIKGKLYDYILQNYPNRTREEIKNFMFVVLFGKNDKRNKENKTFKSLFPSIFDFIKKYKETKGGHNKMSHALQRNESKFIFNDIIGEALEKYPDLGFFTVHDSINVKQSDYNKVKKIFDKHLNALYKKL